MSEQLPPEQTAADYRALLIDARVLSRSTHDEISQATGLRPAYLEALEQGRLESMVSGAYVRSILVHYGSYLGLDPDVLLNTYEATVGSPGRNDTDASGQSPDPSLDRGPGGRSHGPRRRSERKWLRYGLLGLLTVGALAVAIVGALQPNRPAGGGTAYVAVATTDIRPDITTTTAAVPAGVTTTFTTTAPTSSTTVRKSAVGATPPTTTKPGKHTVRIVPTGDVWLELTSASGGTVLFRGVRGSGDDLTVKVIGPLKATVGRPDLVTVFLNGVLAPQPRSGRWLITATEVRER